MEHENDPTHSFSTTNVTFVICTTRHTFWGGVMLLSVAVWSSEEGLCLVFFLRSFVPLYKFGLQFVRSFLGSASISGLTIDLLSQRVKPGCRCGSPLCVLASSRACVHALSVLLGVSPQGCLRANTCAGAHACGMVSRVVVFLLFEGVQRAKCCKNKCVGQWGTHQSASIGALTQPLRNQTRSGKTGPAPWVWRDFPNTKQPQAQKAKVSRPVLSIHQVRQALVSKSTIAQGPVCTVYC